MLNNYADKIVATAGYDNSNKSIYTKKGETTMYLGENHCGCGNLEDMIEQIQEVGRLIESGESIEDILKEF